MTNHTVNLSSCYMVEICYNGRFFRQEFGAKDLVDVRQQFKKKYPKIPVKSIFKIKKITT